MIPIFGNVGTIYLIFDHTNDESFFIEEIRYCNCFIDEFQYFIRKNNFKIGFEKMNDELCNIPRNRKMEVFFLYYSKLVIFCCEVCVNFFIKLGKYEMDRGCRLEKSSRNFQITFLKLISKELNSFKLTKK